MVSFALSTAVHSDGQEGVRRAEDIRDSVASQIRDLICRKPSGGGIELDADGLDDRATAGMATKVLATAKVIRPAVAIACAEYPTAAQHQQNNRG